MASVEIAIVEWFVQTQEVLWGGALKFVLIVMVVMGIAFAIDVLWDIYGKKDDRD